MTDSSQNRDALEDILAAAFSKEAHPLDRTRRTTLAEMRRIQAGLYDRAHAPFPDAALLALSILLTGCASIMAVHLSSLPTLGGAGMAAAALVSANLVVSPIAAAIIVVRRRHA